MILVQIPLLRATQKGSTTGLVDRMQAASKIKAAPYTQGKGFCCLVH